MNQPASYVFTLFAAAIVCGILTGIGKETGYHGLIKLLCGVFLMLTLIAPFANLSFDGISPFAMPFSSEAKQASKAGEVYVQNALAEVIKQETQTYILDKASQLQASVMVDVTVSSDLIPIPVNVRITGSVTNEQRKQLEQLITNDLNIAKENQTWIG